MHASDHFTYFIPVFPQFSSDCFFSIHFHLFSISQDKKTTKTFFFWIKFTLEKERDCKTEEKSLQGKGKKQGKCFLLTNKFSFLQIICKRRKYFDWNSIYVIVLYISSNISSHTVFKDEFLLWKRGFLGESISRWFGIEKVPMEQRRNFDWLTIKFQLKVHIETFICPKSRSKFHILLNFSFI